MVQLIYGMAKTRSGCARCQATEHPSRRLRSPGMVVTWRLLLHTPGNLANNNTLQMPFTSGKPMMSK